MDRIILYDSETTNSSIFGSIIEFGAVVVDKNLKELEKVSIRGRLPEGEVPSAKALLVNSTSVGIIPISTVACCIIISLEIIDIHILRMYRPIKSTMVCI